MLKTRYDPEKTLIGSSGDYNSLQSHVKMVLNEATSLYRIHVSMSGSEGGFRESVLLFTIKLLSSHVGEAASWIWSRSDVCNHSSRYLSDMSEMQGITK